MYLTIRNTEILIYLNRQQSELYYKSKSLKTIHRGLVVYGQAYIINGHCVP